LKYRFPVEPKRSSRIFILADDWDPGPFRFLAKKYKGVIEWHHEDPPQPSEPVAVLDELGRE
jgi:hypothetical protein